MLNTPVARCPKKNFDVDHSVGRDLWTEFAAVIPSGHTLEMVCQPRYFGLFKSNNPAGPRVADNGLRVRDRIHVAEENGAWVATLIVRHCPKGIDEVHTAVLQEISFEAGDLPEGYTVEHRGPRGWVIYLNGEEVEPGFETPEAAEKRIQYFKNEEKVQARVDRANTKPKQTRRKKAEAPAEEPVIEEAVPAAE